MKRVIVLADAAEDIETARDFYEAQETGVGEYCVDSLLSDIESLGLFSGIHDSAFRVVIHCCSGGCVSRNSVAKDLALRCALEELCSVASFFL